MKNSHLLSGFGPQALPFLLLAAFLFLFVVAPVNAQTPPQSPVPLPVPFTPIIDNANVIDAQTRERLESIYRNLKERANIEYAVLTVPTTGEQDIFDFSLAVARGWGIGSKEGDKAAFLLVVAINDRKYFTQVSDHLEGDLPDGLAGQIQRERLVPQFRQRNYSQGIYDTVQAYVATLAQKRGFTVDGIDQSYAYRGEPEGNVRIRQAPGTKLSTICCGGLVLLAILIAVSLGSRGGPRGGGRRRGWGGGGWWQAALLASLLNSGSSGGRSRSGWGGGGFGGGGFGGGGGGGFGGGFGGGGSFGGGGAGGSW